jgi:hypothetical protein
MRALALLLVAIGCFYLFYSGAMAVWSYLTLSGIVEDAVQERGRTAAGPVREAILRGAAASGLALDEGQVLVETDERALNVHLRWTWPLVTYQGTAYVEVPLSLERSFAR